MRNALQTPAFTQALELLDYLDEHETGELLSRLIITAALVPLTLRLPEPTKIDEGEFLPWDSCWRRGLARIAALGEAALAQAPESR